MSEATGTEERPIRTYRAPQGRDWWLRRRSYFLYMVRELTVLFMVAWLLWFLYQVALLKQHAFETLTGNYAVLAFSAVCLFFTLWHAVTFLNLSGLILRVPIGDRFAPASAIKVLAFGGLLFVTAVGAAIMIALGYVTV